MIKLAALCFISTFLMSRVSMARTLDWNEVESVQTYKLNQNISFPGVLELHAGESIVVTDIVTGEFPFIYIQSHLENCQTPNLKADMVLANTSPEDTSRDRSVGLQLDLNCELDIFIEPSDIMTKSLLKE